MGTLYSTLCCSKNKRFFDFTDAELDDIGISNRKPERPVKLDRKLKDYFNFTHSFSSLSNIYTEEEENNRSIHVQWNEIKRKNKTSSNSLHSIHTNIWRIVLTYLHKTECEILKKTTTKLDSIITETKLSHSCSYILFLKNGKLHNFYIPTQQITCLQRTSQRKLISQNANNSEKSFSSETSTKVTYTLQNPLNEPKKEEAKIPADISYSGILQKESDLYITGGRKGTEFSKECLKITYNSLHSLLNSSEIDIQRLSSLEDPLSNHKLLEVNEHIFSLGGLNSTGDQRINWKYSIQHDQWTQIPSFQKRKRDVCAAKFTAIHSRNQSALYVFGGISGLSQRDNHIERIFLPILFAPLSPKKKSINSLSLNLYGGFNHFYYQNSQGIEQGWERVRVSKDMGFQVCADWNTRIHCRAIQVGENSIILFGGTARRKSTCSTFQFDVSQATIQPIQASPLRNIQQNGEVFLYGSQVYSFEGDYLHKFNLQTQEWQAKLMLYYQSHYF
jgi:hypothetical protein